MPILWDKGRLLYLQCDAETKFSSISCVQGSVLGIFLSPNQETLIVPIDLTDNSEASSSSSPLAYAVFFSASGKPIFFSLSLLDYTSRMRKKD